AQSFRPNPAFDTETVITELGVGEALVSTLGPKGTPTMVARTLIRPPSSRLGPATKKERKTVMADSPVAGRYDEPRDRESAYEILEERREETARRAAETAKKESAKAEREKKKRKRSGRQGYAEAAIKSALRTASNRIANAIVRGLLGGLRR
ncbi:MAG: DUF853 domain-containing protein, partial [Caulobacterales bacterium]|nr:DUF853 domain-containing protein [Caulobacterales bacterium]